MKLSQQLEQVEPKIPVISYKSIEGPTQKYCFIEDFERMKAVAIVLAKACENQHAVWVGDYKNDCMSECTSTCRALTRAAEILKGE